jgi:hypothetical protein
MLGLAILHGLHKNSRHQGAPKEKESAFEMLPTNFFPFSFSKIHNLTDSLKFNLTHEIIPEYRNCRGTRSLLCQLKLKCDAWSQIVAHDPGLIPTLHQGFYPDEFVVVKPGLFALFSGAIEDQLS